MEKTTLYLPSDLQRGLRELARRSGRPQASLIRDALERYLANQERPRPRSIGAASDGTLDASESGAWLRAQWSPAPTTGSSKRSGRGPRRSESPTTPAPRRTG